MNDELYSESENLPRDFGDYVLLRCLGRGGMGKVYLAKVKAKGLVGVDKLCVVKTLRVSHDPEYQRRFVDEARLIVLLTHRNICHVFDAGCFEDQYYLAMEHINGRELRHVQQMAEDARITLPVDVSIFVVKEVLEALDAAHRMKHPLTAEPLRVVHRDVSPQNVMLSSEGEVKLIDFGLAESTQKLERTAPHIVMGKIAYMAPEQARGEGVDGRADQFAAGVLLYELLANERYYGDLPFDDVWRTSGRGGFSPTGLSRIQPELVEVIKKATAPHRELRYESCGDMRAVLQQVELKRGKLAGSREVRQAFQELLDLAGESMPSASNAEIRAVSRPPTALPTPATIPAISVPALPVNSPLVELPSSSSPPRERTRTFRIRSTQADGPRIQDLSPSEKTEIGFVIEGLRDNELPPALATGDAFRPVSLLSSSPSVARAAPMPVPTATLDTEEDAPKSRALLFAAAGALLVAVVVVAFVVVGANDKPVAIVEAGAPVVALPVEPALPVVPVLPVLADAGSVVAAQEPTDAGVVVVADAGGDLDLAEIDRDDAGRRRPRNNNHKQKRVVPDFPPDGNPVLALNARTRHLQVHCGDVDCYPDVQAAQQSLGTEALKVNFRMLQNQCLRRCRKVACPRSNAKCVSSKG